MMKSIILPAAAAFFIMAANAGDVHKSNLTIENGGLPVVDLGYELHRAAAYNSTAAYYNFTNIRYAAPPIGELRFRAPLPPAVDRSTIRDGTDQPRVCMQAGPLWALEQSPQFTAAYLAEQFRVNGAGDLQPQPPALPATLTPPPSSSGPPAGMTEDCLFLDVFVPKKVLTGAVKGKSKAPVLVWIYGGGYTEGQKDGEDPRGLLERSGNEIIFVELNYRLGAYGWLAGDGVAKDGTVNAALYDQRLALKWVQDHIADFGGDPDNVTVFGESAGGGSILHQITAFGGTKEALFQRAIPQSAAWIPLSKNQSNMSLNTFLKALNVSTVAEARKVDALTLAQVNANVVADSAYGTFTFGPVTDGIFAPENPLVLLSKGSYNKDIQVLVGHNALEGLVFTNPASAPLENFRPTFDAFFPQVAPAIIDEIVAQYPPIFNTSRNTLYDLGYNDPVSRIVSAVGNIGINCAAYAAASYIADAKKYEFAIWPSLHGFDIPYTFYTGPATPPVASRMMRKRQTTGSGYNPAAITLQQWIVNFAKTGEPTSAFSPPFPEYGSAQNVLNLVSPALPPLAVKDSIIASRCELIIKTLFPAIDALS